ncbi:tRNA 2-thiouridine(34) synthase MnmA [Patescibacteria group bacterium]|nr:tRNA 2-thiouridine(34) synthase MnmA [Patescibacteria group bacterium]
MNKRRKLKEKKLKVLVAMSGGVDSSVAALIMKKKGYDVIGAFMKNWSETKNDLGECRWKEDRKEAIKISEILKIPLITFDFEKEYRKEVVERMFKLYKSGITPNPDIDCNQKIKFPLIYAAAKKLGADFIVTGHYAQVKHNKKIKKYELHRAKDESKDQSYFLYRLSQKDLEHSLFPIGSYTKNQVRKIAKENNFPNFNRKGTVGICFIGKINLKEFLQKKIKPKKGKILNPAGKFIGYHDGIYYYTIGQRIGPRFGIEIEKGEGKKVERWYVAKKDLEKNEIIAAPKNHPILYRKEITLKDPHWIGKIPQKNKVYNLKARIRQVGELMPSKLFYDKKIKQFRVILKESITGISEGQAIVLYNKKNTLGGGVIKF